MSNVPNQLILDQMPGNVAWKDRNLKYLGANRNLINSLGLKHAQDLIGIDDKQLALNTPQLINFFKEQDLLALQGHTIEVIHGLEDTRDSKTYFLQKSPLRDDQNQVIGVIYLCVPWVQENLLAALKQIDRKHYEISDGPVHYDIDTHHNPVALSNRERECLFLQIRGKTAKEIAAILQLSKRTIEYYIDNMKAKFGCLNKSELLIAAMTHGYQHQIPKSLLNLNVPELLSY